MTCQTNNLLCHSKPAPNKNVFSFLGFTLVETLVAMSVLGIFFAAVALIMYQILRNVGESRVRTIALSLAQTKMENINNLPYADVGTVGGIPAGPIDPEEYQETNGMQFKIVTSIVYIDDPFDQLAPNDLTSTDYKRVRVAVDWVGIYAPQKPVTLVTNISPSSIEEIGEGGTLRILVFNSLGNPVEGATVNIDNTAVTPEIHTQELTNEDGEVTLPGSPACVSCYEISTTMSLFSTDRTYSTTEVANPLQPHATVIEGEVTQLSFAIDHISSVTVRSFGSRESGYPPVSNVFFTIRGSKIIGFDTQDNPVYKYEYSTNTGGGTVSIPDIEWDTYELDFTNSNRSLAGSNPTNPFALLAHEHVLVNIVAVPKTTTNLLVEVDNAGQELLASASARLTNATLEYDETIYTGATGSADFGQAFFGGLTPETYDLVIKLDEYEDATSSLTLSDIHHEKFTLNSEL